MVDNEKKRLSRLTSIITILQSKKIVTASIIAKKFNISIRTVYRDIRALEQSGIPILTEEGKGYSIMEEYSLPPVMFTEAEANALITAEQLILKNKDASLVENYKEAITKIKAQLKYKIKDKIEFLTTRLYVRSNIKNEITSNNLSSIQSAIINFNLLQIQYQDENKNTTSRVIEPLALYTTQDNWILIAYCRNKKANRAFRLDRIRQLHALNDLFEPHDFNLQNYFEQCKENNLYL